MVKTCYLASNLNRCGGLRLKGDHFTFSNHVWSHGETKFTAVLYFVQKFESDPGEKCTLILPFLNIIVDTEAGIFGRSLFPFHENKSDIRYVIHKSRMH